VRRRFDVVRYGDTVEVDSPSGSATVHRVPKLPDPQQQVAPGSLLSPMPAAVSRVAVTGGERVRAGQPLLWLEAMKMEHRVDAPTDGVVAELRVEAGSHVAAGAVLAIVTEEE
jgi:propionyl-CoA carboxylase alpha chain